MSQFASKLINSIIDEILEFERTNQRITRDALLKHFGLPVKTSISSTETKTSPAPAKTSPAVRNSAEKKAGKTCVHILTRGINKDKPCGVTVTGEGELCATHKKKVPAKSLVTNDNFHVEQSKINAVKFRGETMRDVDHDFIYKSISDTTVIGIFKNGNVAPLSQENKNAVLALNLKYEEATVEGQDTEETTSVESTPATEPVVQEEASVQEPVVETSVTTEPVVQEEASVQEPIVETPVTTEPVVQEVAPTPVVEETPVPEPTPEPVVEETPVQEPTPVPEPTPEPVVEAPKTAVVPKAPLPVAKPVIKPAIPVPTAKPNPVVAKVAVPIAKQALPLPSAKPLGAAPTVKNPVVIKMPIKQ